MKKESTMVRLSKGHLAKLQKMAELDNRSATNFLERMIEKNYKKMEESKMSNYNYGTVDFKGETYTLLCDAWINSNGDGKTYTYIAKAELDEKEYLVSWETTEKWDKAEKLKEFEEKLSSCDKDLYPREYEYLQSEIKELEDEGIESYYAEDESNACDWENPISVEGYL